MGVETAQAVDGKDIIMNTGEDPYRCRPLRRRDPRLVSNGSSVCNEETAEFDMALVWNLFTVDQHDVVDLDRVSDRIR